MLSKYNIYFIILSFVGYIYECIAMVIWTGKWDNRGFLYGPVIPIYGFGALTGTILFNNYLVSSSPLQVFLISVFASALLEYVVHYTLEKLFNAYWWDYSKSPLNINGRICLPASLGFGIAGLIIIYVINPFLLPIINNINDNVADIISLLLCVIFTADFTLTISVLSSFQERVMMADDYINEHMESLVGTVTDESKGIGSKFYNAVDRLEEARKRVIGDRIEKIKGPMARLHAHSLSKIKGFTGKNAAKLNKALSAVKHMFERVRNRNER